MKFFYKVFSKLPIWSLNYSKYSNIKESIQSIQARKKNIKVKCSNFETLFFNKLNYERFKMLYANCQNATNLIVHHIRLVKRSIIVIVIEISSLLLSIIAATAVIVSIELVGLNLLLWVGRAERCLEQSVHVGDVLHEIMEFGLENA